MTVQDVSQSDFQQRVIARSSQVPVVVDFWAEWCGPCRMLGPVLEREVAAREGSVELAKVDVDANQELAARYGVSGIPAVKAFRDGEVAEEFVGAQPPAAVSAFLDRLVPSEADELAASEDEAELRRALDLDPRHPEARRKLAALLLKRDQAEEARELLGSVAGDFVADGLLARAELALDGAGSTAETEAALQRGLEAWDVGDPEGALEPLQEALAAGADTEWRDRIRRLMVAIFTELGADSPLVREHRRRLAAALN
jgi:putative thioredoxin